MDIIMDNCLHTQEYSTYIPCSNYKSIMQKHLLDLLDTHIHTHAEQQSIKPINRSALPPLS